MLLLLVVAMEVKLRQVGNSIGVTIPSSELRSLQASAGDLVEIEIKRVVRKAREGWYSASLWQNAMDEPILLEGIPDSSLEDEGFDW